MKSSKVGTVTDANEIVFHAVVTIKTFGMEGILKAEIYSGVIFILHCHKQCRKCNRF
jgi:hypothetical protein